MDGVSRRLIPSIVCLTLATACGGAAEPPPAVPKQVRGVVGDRPPVAAIVRDGDPGAGLAVAVWTYGVAPERGAQPAVALAALTQVRLAARWPAAVVTPAWEGYRVRGLLGEQPSDQVTAVQRALLAPVTAAEMPAVVKKLRALASKPLHDPGLAEVARCRGEAFGAIPAPPEPVLADVEAWRRAAHGLGRVALSVAGVTRATHDVVTALNGLPAWPRAAQLPGFGWPEDAPPPVVYDARSEGVAEARAILAFRTGDATRAAAIAPSLGDPRGPLASRLEATESGATVREVTATAHAQGGCLTVTLDARDLGANPTARIATAIALVRQEVLAELADTDDAGGALDLARRAGDPRDAAERGAWWTLYPRAASAAAKEPRMLLAVGFAGSRDATAMPSAEAVRTEVDRALAAWKEPVVEPRLRVERGQSDLWLLLASPCGTVPEVESDSGLGAGFAMLAAERARDHAGPSLEIVPWASADAIGLLAHGPALPGETPLAQARRIADTAARAFAEGPERGAVSHVRASLLSVGDNVGARALVALSNGIVPGRPSWFSPSGSLEALARASDGALGTRASGLRAGPMRVAVLANESPAQGAAAARAVDRWVPRRASGDARACPTPSEPPPPRPGTYWLDPTGSPEQAGQAWLALPLPRGDEKSVQLARFFALALDGEDGLLARGLGRPGLARSWSATVVGPARGSALVVRIASADGALDGAVAQTRVLLDRLRQRGLDEADRQRAAAARTRAEQRALLEPHGRLLALFRDALGHDRDAPPPLDALRSFAATVLRDDALVIVAARPPRAPKATP
ncbi:hypothetical protein LVJ94_18585 [Pendulispora rubella]|uniref:Peptidase M16 C-terminal domain-containing protein n=1 Tax=Pendulispora rubella TaxID=2741070 RepID=A0ABZ2LEB3_9BACT